MRDNAVATLDAARVKTSLTAARASQRQDKPGLVTADEEALPQVHAYTSCFKKDVENWLREVKEREVDGRHVLNKEQYKVLSLVGSACALKRGR